MAYQQNWKWFYDNAAEPTIPMAGENIAATIRSNSTKARLRVTLRNVADPVPPASAIYTTDFPPTSMLLDYPYAWVVGTGYSASKYWAHISKYDISVDPWVEVDSADHYGTTYSNTGYYEVVADGAYIYVCGAMSLGYTGAEYISEAVIRKFLKTDLTTPVWSVNFENPRRFWFHSAYGTASFNDLKVGNLGGDTSYIYVGGTYGTSLYAEGMIYKLNKTTGAVQWMVPAVVLGTDGHNYYCYTYHISGALKGQPITGANWASYWRRASDGYPYTTWAGGISYDTEIYSSVEGILGFYSNLGIDYVDHDGSYGGNRLIERRRISDGHRPTVADGGFIGQYASFVPVNYAFTKGCEDVNNYYLPSYLNLGATQGGTMKVAKSAPGTKIWEVVRDTTVGQPDYNRKTIFDGTYVYSLGVSYVAGVPNKVTYEKFDLDGNTEFSVVDPITGINTSKALTESGDYLFVGYNVWGISNAGTIKRLDKATGLVSSTELVKLEYSTDEVTWYAVGAAGAHWDYANGKATEGNTVTGYLLTDATEAGKYHEGGSLQDHATIGFYREMDFAVVPTAYAIDRRTYYFRVTFLAVGVSLGAGKTHPAIQTSFKPDMDERMRLGKWFYDQIYMGYYLG